MRKHPFFSEFARRTWEVSIVRKSLVTLLSVIALILALTVAAELGILWYRDHYFSVDKTAYSRNAQKLDLRDRDISLSHYERLREKLPDCEILWDVPFQGRTFSSDSRHIQISSLSEADIQIVKACFPELKEVNAADCSDYAMLEKLKQQLPGLQVNYAVSLGPTSVAPDAVSLTLEAGEYTLDAMMDNLAYLPKMEEIQLNRPQLTLEQAARLQSAYSDIAFVFTIEMLGKTYRTDAQSIDLSQMTDRDLETVSRLLPWFADLTSIDLVGDNAVSPVSKATCRALQEANEALDILYRFDFYGDILSTAAEEIHIADKEIGDAGEAEVREALELLVNCKRFVLESCGMSNEVLANLREDYRGRTKVVWNVAFGKGGALTDVEVLRCTYDLFDSNCEDLIYCEDVRYLDIGHNTELDKIQFIAGMPKLEVLILSAAPVKDLTPLSGCKKLRILEAAYCYNLKDIRPLAQCESLELLNISYTRVRDLSPLENLNISNLCAVHETNPSVVYEERERIRALKPEWEFHFFDANPYGHVWRYDNQYEKREWYAQICDIFGYPESPNNTGWYLD